MPVFVPLLTSDQVNALPEEAQSVVDYRKSGLSLNHIQGCPLDCAYCIRHTYGVWDMRQPKALMPDEKAVAQLVGHHYFQPHITPIQVFNRATDPFLPRVKEHLFAVLEDLDERGLTNHVLVITRYRVDPEDCWTPSRTATAGRFSARLHAVWPTGTVSPTTTVTTAFENCATSVP